jgi:hypothetical protein
VDAVKARFRELHAGATGVQIKLATGETMRGNILQLGADTFTIAQDKTGQQRTLRYSQVTEVKAKRRSRDSKTILIPAIVGAGAVLVLCAAPYPIGFLCRKDPS